MLHCRRCEQDLIHRAWSRHLPDDGIVHFDKKVDEQNASLLERGAPRRSEERVSEIATPRPE